MQFEEFIKLVADMRGQQKAFFKARKTGLPEASTFLQKSKELEKQVDDFIKLLERQEAEKNTPTLF